MPKVVMYSSDSCPYCIRAERLLARKGVAVIDKRSVDGNPELWDEIEARTGRDTVPQIYIGDHYVGGYDDLVDLDFNDGLEPLLAED